MNRFHNELAGCDRVIHPVATCAIDNKLMEVVLGRMLEQVVVIQLNNSGLVGEWEYLLN